MFIHARTPATITRGAVLPLALVVSALVAGATSGVTEQVSVSGTDEGGNELSRDASISADGRFVAFVSGASNLAAGDVPVGFGLFVRDRLARTTERIALPAGVTAVEPPPSISGDGRFVAFAANGPEPDVHSIITHIYLHDRAAGTTEKISITPVNLLASFLPQISADGRVIAYFLWTESAGPDGKLDVLVYNRDTRQTANANRTSAGEVMPSPFDPDLAVGLSGDGRIVAFTFNAALVPGVPAGQVFVHDMLSGATTVASTRSDGVPSEGFPFCCGHFRRPAVSADGRFVAFYSSSALVPDDTNGLQDAYVRDLAEQTTERVSVDGAGKQVPNGSNLSDSPAISADGRIVAFVSRDPALTPGDTNDTFDVFLRDRQAGTTERVSVATNGAEGNGISFAPALTADGRTVAFTSEATNLSAAKNPSTSLDVYVRQMVSSAPVLSAIVPSTSVMWPPNGRFVDVALTYEVTGGVGQPQCAVTVASNEAPARNATRRKSADWEVVDAHMVRLKAARSATGSGRVYTVTVRCVDGAGQAASGSTAVTVPHDQRVR